MRAEDILYVLEKQSFHDWYEGEFAEYLQDSNNPEAKAKVLDKICQLFAVGLRKDQPWVTSNRDNW